MAAWSFAPSLEPEAVFEAACAAMRAPLPPAVWALFERSAAPAAELALTPVSARVCAAALLRGHDFVHHELRSEIPTAASGGPADTADSAPSAWHDGVRQLPKYAQARLEAPLAVYDPNHRLKWRAHELLHRRVGFFWRPDQTPFEAYLGARLSELLPVVHWYGFDEAFRARCPAHAGRAVYRVHCENCEALGARFDARAQGPTQSELAHARENLRHGFDHYESELACVDAELREGRQRASPRGPLDASSDAQQYASEHWDRITAWSFGAWVEFFSVEGQDFAGTASDMRARVGTVLQEFMCGPLDVDPGRAALLRERQHLRELGYRVLRWLEDEANADHEPALWPSLERAGAACASVLSGGSSAELGDARQQLLGSLDELPPDKGRVALVRTGAAWPRESDGAVALEWATNEVLTGLRSALPDTLGSLSYAADASAPAWVEAFACSPQFRGPGELRTRFIAFLQALDTSNSGSGHALTQDLDVEAITLECFVRARPQADAEASRFAVLPDASLAEQTPTPWPPGRLRLHATFRRGRFGNAAIQEVLGWDTRGWAADRRTELARVFINGDARIVELDAELGACVDRVQAQRGEPGPLDGATLGLLEAQILVWLPLPR